MWLKLLYSWFVRLFAKPTKFKEIERKYLLVHLPAGEQDLVKAIPRDRILRIDNICQFWLPGMLIGERFRRKQRTDVVADPEFFRTIKFGEGIEREEIEESCDPKLYAKMESAAASYQSDWPIVIKTRWSVQGERPDEVWEIDVNNFGDWHGFALAGVELSHRSILPIIPKWLAPYVMLEVTNDRRYNNYQIGKDGFPKEL
jgi:CYTH domain-containing protein